MKATSTLMSEHRVIEQVLSVLEEIASRAERDGMVDTTAAGEVLDFFRNYADGCHHAKEELYLFPLLENRGLPREGGPTGVMLHEHDLGRKLLSRMSVAIEGNPTRNKSGHPDDAPTGDVTVSNFVTPARDYVMLMKDHIRKEDERLFRMADRLLGANDDENLMRAFDAAEHAEMDEGKHDHYLQLANRLADQFGIARAETTMECGHYCTAH